jgi:hypothetical protein
LRLQRCRLGFLTSLVVAGAAVCACILYAVLRQNWLCLCVTLAHGACGELFALVYYRLVV